MLLWFRSRKIHGPTFFNGAAICAVVIALTLSPHSRTTARAATSPVLLPISIDYPEADSIFPPGITPPTFLWRDAAGTSWSIEISFADGTPPVRVVSAGQRMQLGEMDPAALNDSNQPLQLTPEQAAAWTWKPDSVMWSEIQTHSITAPARLTITGFRDGKPWSRSRTCFSTSKDEVGAPIFYRDVPLMPTANTSGEVSPLANGSIPLIRWRLRDIRRLESRTVLKDMPTCANCHSFSADGTKIGMDIDGPSNDKGLYAVAPVAKQITIGSKDLLHWNTDNSVGKVRVGFMSQLSSDGRYVLTTFAGPAVSSMIESYYVTNFLNYRFLQVFYPTRGILEYFDRKEGLRHPLPGADDPKYVQTDGVWSRDGKWIVFARALARDPRSKGQLPALHALDENETPIQYDLYRIPFNNGQGGTAERIAGASRNGMSNSFPKISPDGKWIVFVQSKNGQLMRPDSQLYIVPFAGGVARRMRANTRLMNSWHSFSPNGRWLVFSSKARSPYTQMYLTHIDENGNDSPAILVDNATAANRAVNIPEFVNIAGDGIEEIRVSVVNTAPGEHLDKEAGKTYEDLHR